MDTIFMNSENSKTSESHVLILKLTDKLNLKRGEKKYCFIKSQYLLHMEKHKISYNINKFEISAPTLNDKFKLPDGSYSVLDIQDYFNYNLKKHEKNIDNASIKRYVIKQNYIQN